MSAALLSRVAMWPGLSCAAAPRAAGELDDLVVARARRGDHAAFADVVRHYDHRLRALAFRLLGDRDRMDDVLQEVYVKAFRSLPGFKGASGLGTWLYRITYNACIDDLRRRPQTIPGTDDEHRSASFADPRPGPADVAVGRADLAAALDRLPLDQRAAVSWSTPTGWTTPKPPRCSGCARGPSAPGSTGHGRPCGRRSTEGRDSDERTRRAPRP